MTVLEGMNAGEKPFNPAQYGGWPDALMRMAARMLKENMSDMDAAELKVASGVLNRALKEITRLNRQIGVLTSIDQPLPGLRVEDVGAFFNEEVCDFNEEVCEKMLNEVFDDNSKLSDMPAAREYVGWIKEGMEEEPVAQISTEEAHRRVSEGLGAAIARRVDAEMLDDSLRPGIVGHNVPVKGIAQGLTTEEGQVSERMDRTIRGLQKRVEDLETTTYGYVRNG